MAVIQDGPGSGPKRGRKGGTKGNLTDFVTGLEENTHHLNIKAE